MYVVEGYYIDRIYMTNSELDVLKKLYLSADKNETLLTNDEKNLLRLIISQYSKPTIKNERISQ